MSTVTTLAPTAAETSSLSTPVAPVSARPAFAPTAGPLAPATPTRLRVAGAPGAPAPGPARSEPNLNASATTLDLVGLPPQLAFLAHGAFYQFFSRGAGVLTPRAISYELAGVDVAEVSRRLTLHKPHLARIPENVANPILSAVSAYLKVARAFGSQLSVARAVFGDGDAHVFVPNGPEHALKTQFLAAEAQARARVEEAKREALDTYETWYGEMRAILSDFLGASHQRLCATGRFLSPHWVDDALARLLAQVPTREDIAAITVGYRDKDGDVFLTHLVQEHRALDEKVRLAAQQTVAYAEELQREDLELQAAQRRERYIRAHEALLADLANPFQEMATQLRASLRESLTQIAASLERNGGRLTRPYKKRLEATLALFSERNFAGDQEIEDLMQPIRSYLATYRPPKKARTGQTLPALGPTLIQDLTGQLLAATYQEARAALLSESAGAALDL